MSDMTSVFQWLNAHPELAGLATFIISAAESIAIIGTIVPGTITMTAIGALAGAGVIPLWSTLLWAILGAVVGDGISYWIGVYFKDRLPHVWPFRTHPMLLENGERFFSKYGGMSVFIGRFVGPVRALVPLVAGMLSMSPTRFLIYNISSAILWAPVYMLPGILLGLASLELPPEIAFHVTLVFLLTVLFILLCLWLIYQFLRLVRNQIDQFLNFIWRLLKNSRFFSITTIALKHYNPHKTHGQLTLAFYFLITSILLFWLSYYIKLHGSSDIFINNLLFHLFRGIRNDTLDSIMIMFTLFGQKQIIFPLSLTLFAWFAWNKRWRIATHTLLLALFAAGGVFVLKHLVLSHRPWGIPSTHGIFSFPSGHTALATTIYMGIAMIIASALPPKRRGYIYGLTILFILIISVSRLYLGAHWFTDIVGAWLLSISVLMLTTLSYNRKREELPRPKGVLIVTLCTLFVTYSLFWITQRNEITQSYAPLQFPIVKVSQKAWWKEGKSVIPEERVSVFGFPSQRINIEWVGDLKQIQTTLEQQGWEVAAERSWIDSIHRVMDIESTGYLPLVSPRYLDQKPVLVMTKQTPGIKQLLIFRLWDARRVTTNNQPLWVGVVGLAPRTYNWIFKRHKMNEIYSTTPLIFSTPNNKQFMWKIITTSKTGKRKRIIIQPVSGTTPSSGG